MTIVVILSGLIVEGTWLLGTALTSFACDVWMSSPVVGIRPLIPLVFAAFFLLIMEPDEIIRELNAIGYDGPLSVEWEDSGMDREYGAQKALEYWHRGQTLFIA